MADEAAEIEALERELAEKKAALAAKQAADAEAAARAASAAPGTKRPQAHCVYSEASFRAGGPALQRVRGTQPWRSSSHRRRATPFGF